MAQLREILVILCLSSAWLITEATTKTQALRALLNHFNSTRNNVVDPAAKQRARDFVITTFKDHGLDTWTEEFPTNDPLYQGFNIVGRLPGRYTGSPDDKIVLIGSHYDTVQTTPGVDDNGSGMTALLQALNLFLNPDKLNCSRDYTLLFVAFDLEEGQPPCGSPGNCSCSWSRCGSEHFVQNFTTFLNTSGASFQGAFILETILNYNSTPNSQVFPQSLGQQLPKVYQQMQANQFRGNFLPVIGRAQNDGQIIGNIKEAFNSDGDIHFIDIQLPFAGRPSEWDQMLQAGLRDFFRSDHYRFWNAQPSLPAVFISDTANFRGFMQQCYHKSCDDMDHVTPEMVTFLARTTDSIVGVATKMTNETCQIKSKECGLKVMANDGQFTTPYYNTQYPNNLQCTWTITVDAEQTDLRLEFTTFDLEESVDCTADFVEIRDGDSKLLGKFCGKTRPEPVSTLSRNLTVTFQSDELGAFKGFSAQWSSTPVTKSAASGHYLTVWQLIGFLFMTSLACVF